MSSMYLTEDILCPFFKEIHKGTVIKCEGPYPGCTCISLAHENKNEMNKQRELFCCKEYQKCEVYRMIISSKYSDEY